MKLLTGLFRAARKRLLTSDNDMGMFRDKLNELVEAKDSLSDEEVSAKVDELKGFTANLPDDDDKAKLDRFLEDFKSVKAQDAAAAKEAAGMVADLFEKLDTAAMQDVPATVEPAAAEPTTEATAEVEGEAETDGANADVEAAAEETEAPEVETTEGAEAKDADPNPAYSLEEIYQFVKKRQAEDAAAGCQDQDVEEVTEKDDEVVADHAAPTIPVTLGNEANKNGLSAMFAQIKRGDR